MKASTVRVSLKDRSYTIRIGTEILAQTPRWIEGSHAVIITDARLSSAATALSASLKRAGWRTSIFRLRASEELKGFDRVYPLYGELLRAGADRHSVIFAIGGGVIGDAVGFVAGTYLRGIRWVGIPTTLLAQVDSAIGGKTAVNHERGKNLIGVFHQPSLVVCDIALLRSLAPRDVVSGLGEAIKYGLIYDAAFFGFLQKSWSKLTRFDAEALTRVVSRCAALKARAVARDERDLSGVREVLNFGHTVGHALEKVTRYGFFRHGEAIIWGMRVAARLSMLRGHISGADAQTIDAFLAALPVPKLPARLKDSAILDPIRYDKKVRDGRVRFVLLRGIGKTTLDHHVTREEVLAALRWVRDR